MGRKKTESTNMAGTTAEAEAKTKPVRLDLTPEIHRMLRVVAAEDGKAMASYARDELEKLVRAKHREIRGS
jgi:hypothetical protein